MRKENLGKIILELPPKEGNPRNSEGAFLTLDNGEIIFIYSRFRGNCADDAATADLCLMRSCDDGETFAEEGVFLTTEGENSKNIMSISLLRMQNGDVGLFYLVRHSSVYMQLFLRRSSDGGRTWSDRKLCTTQEGYFVVNNDRVIRLKSGRILVPAACHRTCGETLRDRCDGYTDWRSEAIFFISDDDGETWRSSSGKAVMPTVRWCGSGLQEPGALQISDDIIWAWARTDLGRQYEMFSIDQGDTYTEAQPSYFSSPNSPMSAKAAPDGTIYAIWNPIPLYNGAMDKIGDKWTGKRTPLVIAASRDKGRSFTEPLAFETDENSGYCYTAMLFNKDYLLLGYDAGSADDGSCLVRLRIRKIKLTELEQI